MKPAQFGFYSVEAPDREELLVDTLDRCKSIDGLELDAPDETADPESISVDEDGPITLQWTKGPGRVSVNCTAASFPETFLTLSTRRELFVPEDDEGAYEGLTEAVIELIRALSIKHDPYYVMCPTLEPELGPDPTDVVPITAEFELERIPWFGVYSSSFIEEFGGRDHVLETPAWRVEELETGSILMIRTRAPWAKLGRDHPVDRHLLGEDA